MFAAWSFGVVSTEFNGADFDQRCMAEEKQLEGIIALNYTATVARIFG